MNHPLRPPLQPPPPQPSPVYPPPKISIPIPFPLPLFSRLHLCFTSYHHSIFTHLTLSFPFPISSTIPTRFQPSTHLSFLQSFTHPIPCIFPTLSFPLVYPFFCIFPFHFSPHPSSFSPSPVQLYLRISLSVSLPLGIFGA